jgi:hypothetical protein
MSDASEAERLALLAKRRKLMEDWSAFALHRIPPASTAFQHRFISQSLMRLVVL